ncbi:TolC family protein [Parapedobacter sp. 10938]|uniref:TolC family protein n=1 Tax=Parapedobacter flavus TaxID=3110225 RepID=UPI002DBE20FD|nr:TolC family protein [Parapedobacter sp. 10938]MEC3879900.1 TolC family protein [Parapedobacter sp. 10938]
MKNWIFIFFTLTLLTPAHAQESVIDKIDYQYLEKLIQLAKENNIRKKIFEATEVSARASVTAAKASYLDMFQASYFYRPNNKPSVNVINPYLVNGFQLGVSLNLSTLVRTPGLVKQAKQQRFISELELREYEVDLENEVKSQYYNYLMLNNQLEINTQSVQDNQMILGQMQEQFELGEIDLETYNAAKSALAEAKSSLIRTEVEFLVAKDALEAVIGGPLAEITD